MDEAKYRPMYGGFGLGFPFQQQNDPIQVLEWYSQSPSEKQDHLLMLKARLYNLTSIGLFCKGGETSVSTYVKLLESFPERLCSTHI